MTSLWFSMAAMANGVDGTLDGATGVVIRGVQGDVEVVAGAGDALRAESADGDVRLARKGDQWIVTVKPSTDGLKVTVPSSLSALTVHEQVGRLVVRDLPTRLAVVSGRGPVDVTGVGSLRVSWLEGDLTVGDVDGGLVVDRLTGALDARAVGGDVRADGVSGAVTVDDVGGDLAVSGAAGGVRQSNVRGVVSL